MAEHMIRSSSACCTSPSRTSALPLKVLTSAGISMTVLCRLVARCIIAPRDLVATEISVH